MLMPQLQSWAHWADSSGDAKRDAQWSTCYSISHFSVWAHVGAILGAPSIARSRNRAIGYAPILLECSPLLMGQVILLILTYLGLPGQS